MFACTINGIFTCRKSKSENMKKIVFVMAALVLFGSAMFAQEKKTSGTAVKEFPSPEVIANSMINFNIISVENNTFGYDIYIDGNLVIHQPTIPGMPGNEGFRTRVDAEKVVDLVITKIRKGEVPPVVTEEELMKLEVIVVDR
jgi:hypothetical protein